MIPVSPHLVSVTPNLFRALLKCVLGAYLVCLQALREFGAIVKNKQYPQAGRLRANMGNIYYEQVSILEADQGRQLIFNRLRNLLGRRGFAAVIPRPTLVTVHTYTLGTVAMYCRHPANTLAERVVVIT